MFYCETCQLKFEGRTPLYDLYWDNGQRCPACNGVVQAYKAMGIMDKPKEFRFQGIPTEAFLCEESAPVYELENNLGTVFVTTKENERQTNELLHDYKEATRNIIKQLDLMDFNKQYGEFKENLTKDNLMKYTHFFTQQSITLAQSDDLTSERWAEMAIAATLLFDFMSKQEKEGD